jgi:hypothetical protein
MNPNDIDFQAKEAGYMTISWLREAVKEIDCIFGNGYAQKNPSLLGEFIQAAAIKYHASVSSNNSVFEQIIFSLDNIAESIDCAGAKSPPADETRLTALSQEQALSALKACWLTSHPQYAEREYRAVTLEFEKLLGI